jgi:hypothetical protein
MLTLSVPAVLLHIYYDKIYSKLFKICDGGIFPQKTVYVLAECPTHTKECLRVFYRENVEINKAIEIMNVSSVFTFDVKVVSAV